MIGNAAKPESTDEPIRLATSGQLDKYSRWSIVLIALVVAFQLFINDGLPLLNSVSPGHKPAITDSISTEAFERIDKIDITVKTAYFISLLPPELAQEILKSSTHTSNSVITSATTLSPFHQGIEIALNDSLAGLRHDPDATYFARRVMLLRMLLSIAPFDPIPAVGKVKGLISPLSSFEIASSEHPETALHVHREENFWKSTFGTSRISSEQLPICLDELNQYPSLLYYGLIARQQIYLRAGAFGKAKVEESALQNRALVSLFSIGGIAMFAGGLFLVGACAAVGGIWSASRIARLRRENNNPYDHPDIFAKFVLPLPELIANDDRRLRAGDLIDCFAIYLVSLTGFGTILELLVNLVPKSEIQRLSQLHLTYAVIGLEIVSYVGASAFAFEFLRRRAAKKGASISTELGLTKKGLLTNILFGAIGWGTALAAILLLNFVTQYLLHDLPAPENPALPLLSFAPNTISRLALYSLVAFAAPFFEETFFRGVLLNGLLLRFKPIWACVIVGLMFGGIHPVGISAALSLAALGTVFAWMAYLRKSLVPGMFAHFLQNSFAYLTVYFSFSVILRW